MKLFTIVAIIEAEDEYDSEKIANQIDRDVNRGDGIFIKGLWNAKACIQPKQRAGKKKKK